MRANSIKPTVEPNPSVPVVTGLSEALGWVFRVELLPKLCVMGAVEPGKSFCLHPLPDFRGGVSASVDLLKQDPIDLLAFCGLRANKLYREVCTRRPSSHLGNKRNSVRKGRIGLFGIDFRPVGQKVVELTFRGSAHHSIPRFLPHLTLVVGHVELVEVIDTVDFGEIEPDREDAYYEA